MSFNPSAQFIKLMITQIIWRKLYVESSYVTPHPTHGYIRGYLKEKDGLRIMVTLNEISASTHPMR